MTIYQNVALKDDLFTAMESVTNGLVTTTELVAVRKHVAVLYWVKEEDGYGAGPHRSYEPVLYTNIDMLNAIHNLFTGGLQPGDFELLDQILVRYGWMDKNLNSLRWMNIIDLYRRYSNNDLSHSDKSKLNRVLQQITLSKRDMVKYDFNNYRNIMMAEETQAAHDETYALKA